MPRGQSTDKQRTDRRCIRTVIKQPVAIMPHWVLIQNPLQNFTTTTSQSQF